MVKRIIITLLLISPAIAWSFYKPMRVLAPELVSNISCNSSGICIDNKSRSAEAKELYDKAIEFITTSIGKIEEKPKIIFCSTESCFKSFGFNKSTANAVGVSGIVISPRGWKPYYIRHEIIHHLQSEKMGVISQWRSPKWFTEGMAYSLSKDPRKELKEPYQGYRKKFSVWYKKIGNNELWKASREI